MQDGIGQMTEIRSGLQEQNEMETEIIQNVGENQLINTTSRKVKEIIISCMVDIKLVHVAVPICCSNCYMYYHNLNAETCNHSEI